MIVRRTWIAWLILAGFLSTQPAVWVAAHHAALEDDACAGAGVSAVVGAHHQAGPQLEEPNLPNPIDHCVYCHLYRTFSAVRHARVSVVLLAPRMAVAAPERSAAPVKWAGAHADPRGPPVTQS